MKPRKIILKDGSVIQTIGANGSTIEDRGVFTSFEILDDIESLPTVDAEKTIVADMGKRLSQIRQDQDAEIILAGLTDELHKRLHIQARNLLLEYRLSPTKSVPVDKVEDLMRLYGNLIAKLIWDKQMGKNSDDDSV